MHQLYRLLHPAPERTGLRHVGAGGAEQEKTGQRKHDDPYAREHYVYDRDLAERFAQDTGDGGDSTYVEGDGDGGALGRLLREYSRRLKQDNRARVRRVAKWWRYAALACT